MTQEQIKKEILINLACSNKELYVRCKEFFEYIDIVEKENKLKTEKIDELYKDNMILHKEIVLLIENKDK